MMMLLGGARVLQLAGRRSGVAVTLRTVSSQQQQQVINGRVTDEAAPNKTTSSSARKSSTLLQGVVLDHAVDLRSVRPGDRLDIPYELTVSETLQDFWFACFFDQSRIHCSRPFCRQMGLQDRVLPFSLALFLTSSMTHADAAKVQVGFGKACYLWPIFAGDTLRKSFTVQKIKNTSDGNHSVIHFNCSLVNQRGRVCMHADKRMLFQFAVTESATAMEEYDEDDIADTHLFRDHLLSKATTVLAEQPSHSLAKLVPGQLILHSMHRSLPFSSSQQLASLARLTHERHFDVRKYEKSEILVPGGLVLGITMSAAARDLHEVLHEEIKSCAYVNALDPDTVVGAISYVSAVDENLPGDLELVTVTTLGIKNLNVKRDLASIGIPKALFEPGLFAKEIEQICKESCPVLSHKIVVQVERKILRQTSHREVFLL
jgi:citrate lyase subunit beta/citryl-CoA lyase